MSSCTSDCNQGRTCDCVDADHQAFVAAYKAGYECATEGGNVLHLDIDGVPLVPWESIAIYGAVTILSIASLAIIAGATGWIYQTFFN